MSALDTPLARSVGHQRSLTGGVGAGGVERIRGVICRWLKLMRAKSVCLPGHTPPVAGPYVTAGCCPSINTMSSTPCWAPPTAATGGPPSPCPICGAACPSNRKPLTIDRGPSTMGRPSPGGMMPACGRRWP